MQARLFGHSELLTHSGRQFGGVPMNSGKQEQDGELFISLHWALGPHGDGIQGFCICSGVRSSTKI